MTIAVRRMRSSDAEALFKLRRQALIEEPFAFLSSPEDDLASSPDAVRDQLSSWSDVSAVFGALSGDELIGMVGLTQDRPVKAAHRACVWGVFVKPEYRGQGIGARLLEATLDHARAMDGVETVYLSVSEKTPDAKRLYEAAGFFVWGLEPDCIRHGGESAREYHLSLAL
jgi:ribosomal protein S18 acetylase RimI-like enzyme